MSSKIGPVIVDIAGLEMTAAEKDLLQHPSVGGVIFFSRNFASLEQLIELCRSIRTVRPTPLLLMVDHEGGRVQRFQEGFTRLPAMGRIGDIYNESPNDGLALAHAIGWIMAAELLAVGIDLSLAPVLDLHKTTNPAMGDRTF